MTLAVVVRLPFGLAAKLPSLPDGSPMSPPALILMTDSRYTASQTGDVHSDRGAKLWHLGNRIAAVFAGNVELAERGLSATKRRLDGLTTFSFPAIAAAAKEGFTTAVPASRRDSAIDQVQCIIGTVAPTGDIGVIGLNSTEGFEPQHMYNAWAGDRAAMTSFRRFLGEMIPLEVEGIPDGFPIRTDVAQVELGIAAAMNLAVEVSGHDSVGGGVQMVTITASDYRVKQGRAESDPPLPDRVKIFTVGPDEVQGLTGRDGRRKDFERPPSATISDFDI